MRLHPLVLLTRRGIAVSHPRAHLGYARARPLWGQTSTSSSQLVGTVTPQRGAPGRVPLDPTAYVPLIQQLRLTLTNHDPVLMGSLFGYYPDDADERPLAIWGDIAGPDDSIQLLVAATRGTVDSLLADPSLRLDAIVQKEFVGQSQKPPFLQLNKMATGVLVQRWNSRSLDTYADPQIRQLGPIRPATRITGDDAVVLVFDANWYPQTAPLKFFGIAPTTGFRRIADVP